MKRQNVAIVSSGDPAKDREEIEQFNLHTSRMAANICPNGCGPIATS